MRRAALAAPQRGRQSATRIENKQIIFVEVFGDLVKARVLDAACRPIDYQQTNLIATNATPFRRLLCAQLRRQRECEWRRHFTLFCHPGQRSPRRPQSKDLTISSDELKAN
jgi:hypothetical protein